MYWEEQREEQRGCGMKVSAYSMARGGEPLSTEGLLVEQEERTRGIPTAVVFRGRRMENKFLHLRAYIFSYTQRQCGNARE